MGFVVDILQLLVDQLGIDLGGRNVRVSQHLLDGVEIRAVFQQMGGKGVAQGVRGDFCLNSGLLLIVLDDLPKALAAHALPAHIHEQGAFLRVLQHLGPHVLYVVLKRPDSRRVEGDHPLLSPAGTADKAGGQVDIFQIQTNQFRDTDTRGIKQLQHGPIAAALGIRGIRLLQKEFHLLGGKDVGQLPLYLRRGQPPGRIDGHPALRDQIAVERLQRGQRPGYRGRRLTLGRQKSRIRLHILVCGLLRRNPLPFQPVEILGHIPQIGAQRVGGGPLFLCQIVRIT